VPLAVRQRNPGTVITTHGEKHLLKKAMDATIMRMQHMYRILIPANGYVRRFPNTIPMSSTAKSTCYQYYRQMTMLLM